MKGEPGLCSGTLDEIMWTLSICRSPFEMVLYPEPRLFSGGNRNPGPGARSAPDLADALMRLDGTGSLREGPDIWRKGREAVERRPSERRQIRPWRMGMTFVRLLAFLPFLAYCIPSTLFAF